MTDKQIIIDGVDVAGCKDYGYRGKARYWCHNYDEPCTDYPNCYYKQLKRKEQENKKLKEDEKSLLNIIDDLQKEKNKWVEKYNDLGQDFDQLKQTLSSIKNIAEEQVPYLNIGEAKTMIEIEYDYAGKIYNLEQRMYKILQKISKCEGTNE